MTTPVFNITGNTTTGSLTVSGVSSVTGLSRGMIVNMAGVPINATINNIVSGSCPAGCSFDFSNGNGGNTATATASGVSAVVAWQLHPGMTITGTNIPANDVIASLDSTVPSITLTSPAQDSASDKALTVLAAPYASIQGNFDFDSGTSRDTDYGGPL
jgi:CHASE2 domain-containing sensor protein